MIATMYSVRCEKCGGDLAPIVNGQHIAEFYCDQWRTLAANTLDSIATALHHKIEAAQPGDSLPDRIALPKLERLEARQGKIDEAIALLKNELNK